MSDLNRMTSYLSFSLVPFIVIALVLPSPVLAENEKSVMVDTGKTSSVRYSVAAGIGMLTIIGLDLRLRVRESHSPWVFGVHYLNVKDDFINETLAGLPNDTTDKMYTRRFGPEVDYLFQPHNNHSFYVGGGLFSTTKTLKCDNESDSASKTSLFLGGGLQGRWRKGFGYQLGMLISPTSGTTLRTTNCESDESGDFDVNASLFFGF